MMPASNGIYFVGLRVALSQTPGAGDDARRAQK
jgi:hypothetical protein